MFSKGRQQNYYFILNNKRLEVVTEYRYLGVLFYKSGSYTKTKKHIALQATRAMYNLIRNSNRQSFPIVIQIDLLIKQ
jgi:hypothetical protein